MKFFCIPFILSLSGCFTLGNISRVRDSEIRWNNSPSAIVAYADDTSLCLHIEIHTSAPGKTGRTSSVWLAISRSEIETKELIQPQKLTETSCLTSKHQQLPIHENMKAVVFPAQGQMVDTSMTGFPGEGVFFTPEKTKLKANRVQLVLGYGGYYFRIYYANGHVSLATLGSDYILDDRVEDLPVSQLRDARVGERRVFQELLLKPIQNQVLIRYYPNFSKGAFVTLPLNWTTGFHTIELPIGDTVEKHPGREAFVLLYPLTILVDIITLPVQIGCIFFLDRYSRK